MLQVPKKMRKKSFNLMPKMLKQNLMLVQKQLRVKSLLKLKGLKQMVTQMYHLKQWLLITKS
jgi:hypothetical protein